jgi:ABC-type Mn2+/Zn2+ transport system ATPase subunit
LIKNIFCYGKDCNVPTIPDNPPLKISGLYFNYPGDNKAALRNINLTIMRGEKTALVGPNGGGKSTLMRLIIGLEQMQKGNISIFGHKEEACRHRVAMIPQKASVDWTFPINVKEAVTMGRYVHLGWFKKLSKEDKEKVDEAMSIMEISNLCERQIGELSGGQQQRVMLARTIAHDAELLLLDEPLNHVDIATQELMFHTIEKLCKNGKSVIVSTHDLGILTTHFDRAVFLDKTIIADGSVNEVLTAENIAKAYGFEFHKQKDLSPWLNGSWNR